MIASMGCTAALDLMACDCREGFPQVRQVLYQVVDHLKQAGAEGPVDVDALCSGAMWDAIGNTLGYKSPSCCDWVVICKQVVHHSTRTVQ